MKLCQIFIFSVVLWNGPKLTTGHIISVTEGKDVTVSCWFYFPGSKKVFCKNDCKNKEDILVQTSRIQDWNKRYSIEYWTKRVYMMDVTIKNVTKSDSGKYQCVLERSIKNGYYEFIIEVTQEFVPKSKVILKPSVTPSPSCGSTELQTLPLTTFTEPSQTENTTPLQPSTAPPSAPAGMLYFVAVPMLVCVVGLSVILLLLYMRSNRNRTEENPVNTNNIQIPEVDRLYEEIQEDLRHNVIRNVIRTSEIYSLATAPSDHPISDSSQNRN
ncbi:uncharacterized protein LOC129412398 [Boleophthalmus pectinirostris]|uniref:uncharacterized protein LOC129412398 n=1 Tax=Boleophthalmus pectinirostris TaxID=150288 RepID=UPI0024320C1F|nr:uncharacterized protein LOC129412398 [Boleophthalmus pectinirostris]